MEETTIIKAKELESYFQFRIKYLAEHYTDNYELGSKIRELLN